MERSIQAISRAVRRRLKRVVQKSPDKEHTRRAQAILLIAEGHNVSDTARLVRAARSTVHAWRNRFEEYGEDGLKPQSRGRGRSTVNEALISMLEALVQTPPEKRGYLRSRWSSEMLAAELEAELAVAIHPSTVRRLMPRLGFVWRRARPTLVRRDPNKNRKLRAISRALRRRRGTEVFYVDEADVDLNPRIGSAWTRRSCQPQVVTPGQNQKHYLAGALHAHSGKLVWVEHPRKNSLLVVKLLEALRRTYRAAQRIVLILDNYTIHKSAYTQQWLEHHPKFKLLFQPTYSPWVNQIERLWKTMHDTITRNHRCKTFRQLCQRIIRFLDVVQPFPGNQHALAKLTL